jgi:flagellar hook-associated protein 3 FlgL
MRVSTRHQYETYNGDLLRTQSKYFEAQRQVSTGRRLNTVSDDPFGASQVINLRGFKAAAEQYGKNLNHAKGFLGFTESALGETAKVLNRAYEISVTGANSTTTGDARQALVSEVSALQTRLLDVANSRGPNNQFIFAGHRTDAKPFTVTGTTLTYAGDNGAVNAEVGPGETVRINADAGELFRDLYDRLESLKNSLNGGDLARLGGTDLPALQEGLRSVSALRGSIGAKLQNVQQLSEHQERRVLEASKAISEIEDVDMSEAIVQFKLAETTYQAALSSISQMSRLSLMDYLR